jgi:3-deoxy-manno-octulosonate cytidylyltransferase (CMP-KDO synthetase)
LSREYVCVVPARLDSERLPNKMLLAETGKPLICHTLANMVDTGVFYKVVAAVDGPELAEAAYGVEGVTVVQTGHASCGTDRVYAAMKKLGYTHDEDVLVVNVQGDEPGLKAPWVFEAIEAAYDRTPRPDIVTLGARMDRSDFCNPNAVKVTTGPWEMATGFYRYDPGQIIQRHVGVYAMSMDTLAFFRDLPQTADEKYAKLEQLRALGHGLRIKVVPTGLDGLRSIDTREDYDAFVASVQRKK